MSTTMTDAGRAESFAEKFDALARNIESFVRGKEGVVRLSLICLLSEGHLLIDDVPGVGKTSIAKSIARSIGGRISRVQFTPDLLPTDVTGVQIWNADARRFEFHQGPVFANVVLADEINRASPKTQSALLEVMEERQVTVENETIAVPRPFVVIATQNPVEMDGTYQLPEAQIDRFLMRISIGYPGHDAEVAVARGRSQGQRPEQLQAVMSIDEVAGMVEDVRRVHVSDALFDYIVTLTSATRSMPEVRLGVSPRGTLAITNASQARAASEGRTFATADDVKALAPFVLGHRMLLTPEAALAGASTDDLVAELLGSIPVPQERG